jgi:hypothetical protein
VTRRDKDAAWPGDTSGSGGLGRVRRRKDSLKVGLTSQIVAYHAKMDRGRMKHGNR